MFRIFTLHEKYPVHYFISKLRNKSLCESTNERYHRAVGGSNEKQEKLRPSKRTTVI